jgi:hypothetical protein
VQKENGSAVGLAELGVVQAAPVATRMLADRSGSIELIVSL